MRYLGFVGCCGIGFLICGGLIVVIWHVVVLGVAVCCCGVHLEFVRLV